MLSNDASPLDLQYPSAVFDEICFSWKTFLISRLPCSFLAFTYKYYSNELQNEVCFSSASHSGNSGFQGILICLGRGLCI